MNRCRIKEQVQDSSQIDPPSHLRVRQGIPSNVRSLFNISAAQEVGLAAPPTRPGVDSRRREGRAEPHLAVGGFSLLGRVQTGLKGGGIPYSDLTGDSG